mmetsp:Transcript_24404/g.26679  ORF Transcript_24404/g.26679 Transcript_24404/m.26679 type:complete len:87 (-) Transcript_24404:23-283(-)
MFLCMFVMNAIMEVSRVDVLYVVLQESLMPIIVVNVHYKRKIEMDVPKLSILEVLGRIYSMRERNMGSRKDSGDLHFIIAFHLSCK